MKCALTIFACSAFMLRAQTAETHHHNTNVEPGDSTSEIALGPSSIPDVLLTNQRGEKVHFYSDLLRDKIVVINTIFTTCTTICPVMGANFASLRRSLDAKGERNVALISISIDPVADTPERLAEWSHKFGETGPGWTLLTGPKADIDRLLKSLQVFTADKQEHTPVALIGNGTRGKWVRASALLGASRLTELIHAAPTERSSN